MDELKYDLNHEPDPKKQILIEKKIELIKDELVENGLNLVKYLAKKFINRGTPLDDLIQVGCIGLIKAVNRFDTSRNLRFVTFATPTITGEIQRHFRDNNWEIKVSRRIRDLFQPIIQTIETLSQELKCEPTIQEIADYLNITPELISEALLAIDFRSLTSLDHCLSSNSDDSVSLTHYIGQEDKELNNTIEHLTLNQALSQLTELEQQIIYLRYSCSLIQTEIAEKTGYSQMHISRILRKAHNKLKNIIDIQVETDSSNNKKESITEFTLSNPAISKKAIDPQSRQAPNTRPTQKAKTINIFALLEDLRKKSPKSISRFELTECLLLNGVQETLLDKTINLLIENYKIYPSLDKPNIYLFKLDKTDIKPQHVIKTMIEILELSLNNRHKNSGLVNLFKGA